MNFNEFLNENNVNEAFEVHYSDGMRAMKKFNNQSQAISFAKDLIKNKKGLQFVDVFNAGSGFHSTADTDAIVAFWGEGSYTDNKSKKDAKLAAKKIEESFLDAHDKDSEELDEANKFGAPAGLSKAETKKVAELYAKAISKADKCKCTVNTRTLEEDSFDLDIDGEEYDGGSYNIYDNGDVVNHAVNGGEIYGKSNDSVDTIVKNLKKLHESVELNEGAVKQFEKDLQSMIKDIKSGFGWIDPEYVEETWENSSDSIDFDLVKAEIYKRLIDAKLLAYPSDEDEEEAGDYVKSLKELGIKESVEINESRITIKRQYTQNYPAKTVGKHAGVRNKIIEALRDGELTKEEFEQLVSGLTEDSKRWLRRNAQFFNVGEEKISLSTTGQKVLKSIDEAGYRPMTDAERQKKQYRDQQLKRLRAADKKEEEGKRLRALQQKLHQQKLKKANENNDIQMDRFIYESFSEFIENRLNEGEEFLVESFKSSILAGFIDLKFADKQLFKAFYGYTKVALDQIEDADFVEMDPRAAYKAKDLGRAVVFYVSRSEKPNPYAPEDAFYSNKTIPSNALLAIANGSNDFYGITWVRTGTPGGRYTLGNKGGDGNRADTAGIGKKYRSWDATGLSNVKRIAEVADVAYVLPLEVVRQKYSTEGIRAARAAAQAGATALKDAKSFKAENLARYKSILATRIMNDDIDGKVEKAIVKCSELISKAVQAKEFTKYGEIKVGDAPNGREATMRDVTQFMNNLMSDYTDYVRYKNDSKSDAPGGYYEREAKQKAISIKERLAKLDNLNIVW